ncbi:MAG: 30S ribosomal protein S8e [Promethearchaeia archaeon]
MAREQARSKRKSSGKKYRKFRKKRKRELDRDPIHTLIDKEKKKRQRVLGGNTKIKLFSTSYINVTDPNSNETQKVEILDFVSNKASKDLNRRHVLTKGAIVDTELGNVRITSRPGQDGQVNGVLVQ